MMRNAKGFTLIELLIGITILVLVMSTVYASYRIGIQAYKRIEGESYINQNARQAWRVVSRDLRCAFRSSGNKNIRFIGLHGSRDTDRISFTTYGPGHPSSSGGLSSVAYYVDDEAPERGLIRENRGFPGMLDERTSGQTQEIAPLVRSISLRYFDGINWQDSWGTDSSGRPTAQANMLPLAVEIRIRMADVAGVDNAQASFSTVIPVLSN